MAQTHPKQCSNGAFNAGAGSHSRSLSQQSFFVNGCLPPLSPLPPTESSSALSNSNFRNMPIDKIDVRSGGYVSALTSPRENPFRGSNGLPPRTGHRRSNSDVPLGFSDMIQSSPQLVPLGSHEILAGKMDTGLSIGNDKLVGLKRRGMDMNGYGKNYVVTAGEGKPEDELFDSLMNLDHVDTLNSSGANDKDKDTVSSGTKISCGDSSNSESETMSGYRPSFGEGIKRSATGDVTPQFRHSRSLSMDSGIGNFHFGDSSPKLQNPFCNRAEQLSPTKSLNENFDKINLEFGCGQFNEFELKKIMADERLAEIAVSDPKRAKRILANRQSAARSKERKLHYIFELENKVQTLQTDVTTLSAEITLLQKDRMELTNQNNEMKFHIQAMEQQAQLRDALHETLLAEVQRLKLANLGRRDTEQRVPIKHQMLPTQGQRPHPMQQFPVTTTKASTTTSAAPA